VTLGKKERGWGPSCPSIFWVTEKKH